MCPKKSRLLLSKRLNYHVNLENLMVFLQFFNLLIQSTISYQTNQRIAYFKTIIKKDVTNGLISKLLIEWLTVEAYITIFLVFLIRNRYKT